MNASDPKASAWNTGLLTQPPFLRAPGTASAIAWFRVAALFPVLLTGFASGPFAWLAVLAVSLGGAASGNLVASLAQKTFRPFPDAAVLETALIFACLMPSGVALPVVFCGAFLGIALFQKGWGFKGQYPLHPAAAVYVLLRLGFPVMMAPDMPAESLSGMARFFLCPGLGFGEQIPLAVLAGGILLAVFRAISLQVSLYFLAVVSAGAVLLGHSPLLSGDVLFAAFFMVPSFAAIPHTFSGRLVCALLAGVGTVIFREAVFVGPGSAAFGILLANAASPWLDRAFKPAGLRSRL